MRKSKSCRNNLALHGMGSRVRPVAATVPSTGWERAGGARHGRHVPNTRSALVVKHIAPAPAVIVVPASLVEHTASAPDVTTALVPVVVHIAPATTGFAAPVLLWSTSRQPQLGSRLSIVTVFLVTVYRTQLPQSPGTFPSARSIVTDFGLWSSLETC